MFSRTKRAVVASLFAGFLAVSASAAPINDSGDWVVRQINRVIHHIKTILAPIPLDDSSVVPPKP
jgi:hypothetical protein